MTGLPPLLAAGVSELMVRRPVLLAFDFDGVLAPIVDEPSAARALPGTGELLEALAGADRVHVALVSGRALADLRAVAEVPAGSPLVLVGSHGAELSSQSPAALDDAAAELLEGLRDAFAAIAAGAAGLHVETKPAGVVLHTRRASRDDSAVATAAALAAADLPGCHVIRGKEVVEVSVIQTGKGVALDRLRASFDAAGVLYVGDDVTDENAFAVLRGGDVGVKVGEGQTLAAYRLPDPPAVQALLRQLLACTR